jgi:polyhydroxyalkanoate synthesis regulator phasin
LAFFAGQALPFGSQLVELLNDLVKQGQYGQRLAAQSVAKLTHQTAQLVELGAQLVERGQLTGVNVKGSFGHVLCLDGYLP